jgi:transposase
MSKAISNEKRELIIKHKQAGKTQEDIAKWLEICVRTVRRVWSNYCLTGSYEPKPLNCGRKPLVSDETMREIYEKIKEQPDITLNELIDKFSLPISESALCRRLIKFGFTYKKRCSIRPDKSAKM